MKILLDTSILIDFLRSKDKEKTILFKLAIKNNHLYASILTHTELFAGKSVWESKKAYTEVKELFKGITIIPLDEGISEQAGEFKVKYIPDIVDSIIAATANTANLGLVTLNIKDFRKVKGLKLLNIKDD